MSRRAERLRWAALLAQEWCVEAFICFVLASAAAFTLPLTVRFNTDQDFNGAVSAGLLVVIVTFAVRFVLHIPLLVFVRYRLAVRRGFSGHDLMSAIMCTYAVLYLVGVAFSFGALMVDLFSIFFPSLIAAMSAPFALLYVRGENFDSAVAKDAKTAREGRRGEK